MVNGVEVDVLCNVAPEKREACARALNVAKEADPEGFRGVLEPEAIAAAAPLTIDELGEALTEVAAMYAVTPISRFNVGVVVRCNGRLVFGANAEWGPLLLSVHAEQCGVSQTLLNSARCRRAGEPIECLYVNQPPCGHCRQFLVEQEYLQGHDIAVHVRGKKPVARVSELLAEPFTPKDLAIPPARPEVEGVDLPGACARGDIASLASEAFNALLDVSRAPYSGANSACAVQFGLGSGIVAGDYIENCAYNPTFQGMSAALMAARFEGRDLSQITKVLMLEKPGILSNKEVTEMICKLVCPNATFDYFSCGK